MTQTTQLNGIATRGVVEGAPALLLRLEGAVVAAGSAAIYGYAGGGWLMFALLFFVPDVFMLGYLIDRRVGAAIYNAGHSTIGPLALLLIGWNFESTISTSICMIWLAHVGFDRLVGYGFKYADDFMLTHLGTPFARKPVSR